LSKKIYALIEDGILDETRIFWIIGHDVTVDELSEEARKIAREMISALVVPNDLEEQSKTPTENHVISLCAASLDFILADMGLLPRNLNPALYHILTDQEFEHCFGSCGASVRAGHAYFRRSIEETVFLPAFISRVCHETVHLSSAIVVEFDRRVDGSIQPIRIRDGLKSIVGTGVHYFNGLNEIVTDYAAELLGVLMARILGWPATPTQMSAGLLGLISVYQSQRIIIERLCRYLFPRSDGVEGWHLLLRDYWSGSNDFLEQLIVRLPSVHETLRDMNEINGASAEKLCLPDI
jgi:hypothetical protein